MNPEVNLTKLSVNDDIVLDRAVSAYLEFILGCSSVGDCPKKELASYVAGMGAYYCSDFFLLMFRARNRHLDLWLPVSMEIRSR